MGRGEGKKHDEPNDTGMDVLGCVDGLFYDPQALHGYILINTIPYRFDPILWSWVGTCVCSRVTDDRRQTLLGRKFPIINYNGAFERVPQIYD